MNTTNTSSNESNLSVFALMLVLNLVTGLDYANILEHSVKAFVTAFIWLAAKIAADYISNRQKKIRP
jgi:hypothetical protein